MNQVIDASRAKRLRQLTNDVHENLDNSIMAAASFDTLDGYGRFAAMQYRFHRDIDALYESAELAALLPDLPDRRSLSLITADLADLGMAAPAPDDPAAFARGAIDIPTALGWLYVAEGSKMGGALLRKEAAKLGLSDDRGARHLAPAADGPAAHWRSFTAALDAVMLSKEEERRVAAGAKDAFARVKLHADASFSA